MGILYIVATPIGNLEDITLRALRILKEVSLIAAEDTRHTRQLLTHFDIHTPLTSYFEHSKLQKLDVIKNALELGDVALVSDAGTPTINDPGYELIKYVIECGFTVSPIPGPSSTIAALSTSGLPTDSFLFLGYLPRKTGERNEIFTQIKEHPYTIIFLESPNRLVSSLKDMYDFFGDRRVVVSREITKKFEEVIRGTLSEVIQKVGKEPKGEIVLVLEGRSTLAQEKLSEEKIISLIQAALELGEPIKEVASELAKSTGYERRVLYQMALEIKQNQK